MPTKISASEDVKKFNNLVEIHDITQPDTAPAEQVIGWYRQGELHELAQWLEEFNNKGTVNEHKTT